MSATGGKDDRPPEDEFVAEEIQGATEELLRRPELPSLGAQAPPAAPEAPRHPPRPHGASRRAPWEGRRPKPRRRPG